MNVTTKTAGNTAMPVSKASLTNLLSRALVLTLLQGCGMAFDKSASENMAALKQDASQVLETIQHPTVWQGCAAGGLAGLGGGALIDGKKGALIGAGAGAIAGCTAGAILDARRQGYETDAKFYDAQLQATRVNNDKLAENIKVADQRIAVNKKTIATLEGGRQATAAQIAEAGKEHDQAAMLLQSSQNELATQRQALENASTVSGVTPATTQDLRLQVEQMDTYVKELQDRVDELAKQRDTIGNLT